MHYHLASSQALNTHRKLLNTAMTEDPSMIITNEAARPMFDHLPNYDPNVHTVGV
jgi:hypothetical protein